MIGQKLKLPIRRNKVDLVIRLVILEFHSLVELDIIEGNLRPKKKQKSNKNKRRKTEC